MQLTAAAVTPPAGHAARRPAGAADAAAADADVGCTKSKDDINMSILIIQALYEGLIFGADKNITSYSQDGSAHQSEKHSKVLKWPSDEFLFGFVGAATLHNIPIHEWLAVRRAEFLSIASLKSKAEHLRDCIQKQRSIDEGNDPARPMIVHLGGFEQKDGHIVPAIYYISNVYGLGQYGYLDFRKDFTCSEEFSVHIGNVHPSEVRRLLKVRAKQFQPFWFHHGIDLFTFNVLEDAIRSSFKLLCERHPEHDIPNSIVDWEKHVKMQVLMYGAYYEAFHPANEQYVGGGADVVSVRWPD